MQKYEPPYPSIVELLAADARGEVNVEILDDTLWYFMTARGGPADRVDNSSGHVQHYVASRLMEWEVGNGGFAQAAYNIPEWFDAAAAGYSAIGNEAAAERIRRANALFAKGAADFTRGADSTIEQVFSEFVESELSELDEGLTEIDWWAMDERIAYVRANRSAYTSKT
jgi:Domain of unknown function (DUF4375)